MKDFGILYLNDKCINIDAKGNRYKKFKSIINNNEYNVKTKRTEQIQTYCVVNRNDKTILEYCDNINNNYSEIIKTFGLLKWSMKFNKKYNFIDIDITPDRKIFNKNIISIDPLNCKDIDDAIQIINQKENIELYIHISDPSSYIEIDSDLDKEIMNRSASLYVDDTYHMLPEILSTNIISLIEKNERRAYTLKIILPNKNIKDYIKKNKNNINFEYEFIKSTIIVDRNISYDEFEKEYKSNEYYELLYKTGYEIYAGLELNEEYDSHKMIEAYMILCNMCASKECIIKRVSLTKNYEYTIENKKHNELNVYYTHFTSPIRRYIDIVIHRLIYNNKSYDIDNIKKIINIINENNRIYKKIYNIYNLINIIDNRNYIRTIGKILYYEDNNIKLSINNKILNIYIDKRLINNDIITIDSNDDIIKIIQNDNTKIYRINEMINIEIYFIKNNIYPFKIILV